MKKLVLTLAALAFAAVDIGSHAAAPAPVSPDAPAARPSLPSGVAPCESCHGARGEGNPAVGAPRLAAQPQPYLLRQLAGFVDGSRNSQVMTPIAKSLNDQQRNDLAAYYSALEAPPVAAAQPQPAGNAERGLQLAIRGDNSRGIQACSNCHGPEGVGEPPNYPFIAGQHGPYLVAALKAWRDGSRKTDPSGQMPTIARRLSDEDIAALATYYSRAPAPTPEFLMAREPAKAPPRAPVGQAGPIGRPGGQAQGVGTEQGVPTTGGAQGPGGGGGATEERGR